MGAVGAVAGVRRPAVLEDQYDSMAAHVTRVESLLSPIGPVGHGLPVRRLARPAGAARRPFESRADSGVVATACAATGPLASWPRRPRSPARRTTRPLPALAGPPAPAFNEHYVADGPIQSDAPTVYALAIAFGLLDGDRDRAGDRLAELVAETATASRTGFAGTPFVTDALTDDRTSRRGLRAAAPARVPVLALPGHHGRDHGLGALGLDAARRHHQPRRDDQLQPLRARRGRGLDAPHHRRPRAARAGYAAVRLAPRPGGGITWAETSLETPHGLVTSRWRLEEGC